ncbi:ABC transporter permease [Musicola keenii]|uniref:ABC transporter permease n=1 Tax=Musicola keenii TaxID=2884250 RepID=UPI0017855175|nr:ABC transporter permease [Musicola keenii]
MATIQLEKMSFPLRRKTLRLRRYVAQPGLLLAWLVLLTVMLWALFPALFTHDNPVEGIAGAQRLAPGQQALLGTDQLGRDVYTRIVYGASHSLSGAAIAVGLGLGLGSVLGLLAGALGGRSDTLVMRAVDVLLAIPSLLLALTVIILLGFGNVNASIAVGTILVAKFARLVRAEVLRVRNSDYVEAAFGSGGTFWSVLWRHILPNALPNVLAYAALQFGYAILELATLSFLGYGAPPPTPEWGLLIAEGRNYLATAWWLTTFPGLLVVAVVLAANRVSQSLRRA